MAFNLQNIIWTKFFTDSDTIRDSLKDPLQDNKGFMQRYVEVSGEYYDDYLGPLLDNFVTNTVDPIQNLAEFLQYLEAQYGADALQIGTLEALRRNVNKYILKMVTRKGTHRGFEVPFSMIGLDAVITDIDLETPLDSPLTLDDVDRRFDSTCPSCGVYDIDLTDQGSFVLTTETADAIANIINWNQPEDVCLRNITLDGSPYTPGIEVTYAPPDVFWDDTFDPTLMLSLDGLGNLIVEGPNASRYSLNEVGDLLYEINYTLCQL